MDGRFSGRPDQDIRDFAIHQPAAAFNDGEDNSRGLSRSQRPYRSRQSHTSLGPDLPARRSRNGYPISHRPKSAGEVCDHSLRRWTTNLTKHISGYPRSPLIEVFGVQRIRIASGASLWQIASDCPLLFPRVSWRIGGPYVDNVAEGSGQTGRVPCS